MGYLVRLLKWVGELSKTTIMHTLNNKGGSSADINRYRAIAVSNSLSTVLQNVILNCFETCDKSNDVYQFGFTKDILLLCHVQYLKGN